MGEGSIAHDLSDTGSLALHPAPEPVPLRKESKYPVAGSTVTAFRTKFRIDVAKKNKSHRTRTALPSPRTASRALTSGGRLMSRRVAAASTNAWPCCRYTVVRKAACAVPSSPTATVSSAGRWGALPDWQLGPHPKG